MTTFLKHILLDQSGATAVEYGLIIGLIFMSIVTGASELATAVADSWNGISQSISESGL